ncbi:xanthotoxol synthase-like [Salvia hispanica]|uniref:xanthotoxol synthase-like n=1 Tax=Salvia hispanica TaxID=49212 RepID=UPI00200943E0|nr:xanthotoxol synthase-like [Salvia hispanica]
MATNSNHRGCRSSATCTKSKAGFRTRTSNASPRNTAPPCLSSSECGASLKSHDAVFSSRPALVTLSYDRIDVAFSPYNDTWRKLRKISTLHLFSTKQGQTFLPIFRDEVSKMMEKIARDDYVSFKQYHLQSCVWEDLWKGSFHGSSSRNSAPNWSLSGMAAKLDHNFHNMVSFCEELIQEHMNPNRPKSVDGDFIDIMLRIKENGSSSFPLTLEHIKAVYG